MTDKLKYLTTTLNKQIKEQADHANAVEVETKKVHMELAR